MATLTFSFDTGAIPISRIIEGFSKANGYQETIPHPTEAGQTIPNPETKAQFCKRLIKKILIDAVLNSESREAMETAKATIQPIALGD